jgi:hypothetical protein
MPKKTKKNLRFTEMPEQDRVYFFRMNGCGHCESVKQIWPQVVRLIAQTHPMVRLIEVESEEKDSKLDKYAKSKLNPDAINAYPDLRILKKNGETSTFDSERTVPALVAWIYANVSKSPKRIPTPYPKKSLKLPSSTRGSRRKRKQRRQSKKSLRRTRV